MLLQAWIFFSCSTQLVSPGADLSGINWLRKSGFCIVDNIDNIAKYLSVGLMILPCHAALQCCICFGMGEGDMHTETTTHNSEHCTKEYYCLLKGMSWHTGSMMSLSKNWFVLINPCDTPLGLYSGYTTVANTLRKK